MTDESTSEAAATDAERGQQTDTAKETDWQAEAEKWKSLARKHEDTWKANKDKVAEYDRLVEASKTDQQRQEEQAVRLGSLEGENMRLRVALAKGIPLEHIGRLQGSTEEELSADADALLGLVGGQSQQVPDLRDAAGQRSVPSTDNADDWLRRLAGRG